MLLTRKHLVLFWLIVGVPLVVMMGLGWRLAREEQGRARQRLGELLRIRLQGVAGVIEDHIAERERRLRSLTDSIDLDPATIREVVRRTPEVEQVIVLDENGGLIHPDPRGPMSQAEREFLADFGELFLSKSTPDATAAGDDATAPPDAAWIVHFHGAGLQLIYTRRLPGDRLVGILLQRARWISDLIARLPETSRVPVSNDGSAVDFCIRLVDSHFRSIYEWGTLEPDREAVPLLELAPPYPLSAWRLQHFVDDRAFAAVGRGAFFNLLSMVAATGLALVTAGVWFFREYKRNVREATQRVSFVNQVSHELKTPLTNIRMYAELLENDMDAVADDPNDGRRRQLRIIVEESHRLTRLISNVLTFAQREQGRMTLHRRPAVIDDVVDSVIRRFEPAFRRRGIEVRFDRSAPARVDVDVDALEQILGNLLNNVEKYAWTGKRLDLASRQVGGCATIVVQDHGPGIPAHHQGRVFRPFQRLSNDITDTPGTGLGLTIARHLARLHGGDLVLMPSSFGACFEIRLQAPVLESEGRA